MPIYTVYRDYPILQYLVLQHQALLKSDHLTFHAIKLTQICIKHVSFINNTSSVKK